MRPPSTPVPADIESVAAAAGLMLPAECIAGVRSALAALIDHAGTLISSPCGTAAEPGT